MVVVLLRTVAHRVCVASDSCLVLRVCPTGLRIVLVRWGGAAVWSGPGCAVQVGPSGVGFALLACIQVCSVHPTGWRLASTILLCASPLSTTGRSHSFLPMLLFASCGLATMEGLGAMRGGRLGSSLVVLPLRLVLVLRGPLGAAAGVIYISWRLVCPLVVGVVAWACFPAVFVHHCPGVAVGVEVPLADVAGGVSGLCFCASPPCVPPAPRWERSVGPSRQGGGGVLPTACPG